MTYIPALYGTGSIASNAVTDGMLAQAPAHSIKGNHTGSSANVEDMTATQATALLDALAGDSGSGGTKGLVPAPASGDAAAGKVLGAGGGWTTVTGGAGAPQLVTVNLNASQLLASHTTPIQIIAAPGAGNVIVVLASVYSYHFGTTPYTVAGSNEGLYYGTPSGTSGESADKGGSGHVLQDGASNIAFGGSLTNGDQDASTNYDNKKVVFWAAQGDPTAGDGTLKISVIYTTVPT